MSPRSILTILRIDRVGSCCIDGHTHLARAGLWKSNLPEVEDIGKPLLLPATEVAWKLMAAKAAPASYLKWHFSARTLPCDFSRRLWLWCGYG